MNACNFLFFEHWTLNFELIIIFSFVRRKTTTLRKIILLVIFCFASPLFTLAQGEANIWHFGYQAGIDFNSGVAVAIPGYVSTYEGCATICNSAGTLLFATDGVTAYDTNGGIITNGLFGNNSSTQSAIIVPDPGNVNQYY